MEQLKTHIYTDGACSGNPGKGGWGAVITYGDYEKRINGGELETTNNRMELTAVIEALTLLDRPCEIELYTDSQYVMKGATEWIHGWKKKNFGQGTAKEVKNIDLWLLLDKAMKRHRINWHWVKGHNGNKYNEIADQLAVSGIPKS
ncbi:MAG: ribonuclease HI [Proteobacteria bacterium]|nr:ribonuclease HI [Pseudomonadota bacterium]